MSAPHETDYRNFDWDQPLDSATRETVLEDIDGMAWPLPERIDKDGDYPFDTYIAPQISSDLEIIALRGLRTRKAYNEKLDAMDAVTTAQGLHSIIKGKNERIGKLEIDYVTDVLTRGAWEERAAELLKKQDGRYAVMIFDLDHFKGVNDAFGHKVGDKILHSAADAGKRALHTDPDAPEDIVDDTIVFGRLGGEELVALVPITADMESAKDMVMNLAERYIKKTNDIQLPVWDQYNRRIPLKNQGLSAGIVLITTKDNESGPYAPEAKLRIALRRADAALYQAKENGRNQAVLYEWGVTPLKASREDRQKKAA